VILGVSRGLERQLLMRRPLAAISAIVPAIELADIDPPPQDVEEILTGNLLHKGLILGAADLAEHGETIRAGELVICGSVVPPIALSPANIVEFELGPMEPISVTVH